MTVEEMFKAVGRLYIETTVTMDRQRQEIEKLRTEISELKEQLASTRKK